VYEPAHIATTKRECDRRILIASTQRQSAGTEAPRPSLLPPESSAWLAIRCQLRFPTDRRRRVFVGWAGDVPATASTHPRADRPAAIRLLQPSIKFDLEHCSDRPFPVPRNGGILFVLFDLAGARQSP